MAEMIETAYFPVVGVIMGLEKVHWSWESIINKRHGFWLELEMTCARKEPIYMKVFVCVCACVHASVRVCMHACM